MARPKLIGPRRPKGGFFKKRPATVKPRGGKGLTKTQVSLVNRLIVGKSERKYVVSDLTGLRSIVSPNLQTPADWKNPVPALLQGGAGAVQSNQRIGERITNVKGRTHMRFSFDNVLVPSQDVFITIFYGTHKSIKDFPTIRGSAPAGTLLEVGDQSTTDWIATVGTYLGNATQLSMMPVNNTVWSLKKKTLRLIKNNGVVNGSAAPENPNLNRGGSVDFIWNWSHKSALKYDGAATTCTNWAPVYGFVTWYANTITAVPAVYADVRNEMYFHDV